MFQQRTQILRFRTDGPGFVEITEAVRSWVRESGIATGLLTLQIRHTSASLVIQENADPEVRDDFERFFRRLVPEGDPIFRHTAEGPDDMPAHIRAALTATTLSLPVMEGAPALGTWQGIYLWEHRRRGHTREIAVHVIGEP
ncbi:MAG TPA: secondary thiamine-phosphate synthase enzyme YjbQ [Candidatus Polarisedimenticolaceae bacterium]|nr:secondary thiamine-phosphate synthase enzyme YjbQ [Candidatus Polarisedimenticolaceae bacterium]